MKYLTGSLKEMRYQKERTLDPASITCYEVWLSGKRVEDDFASNLENILSSSLVSLKSWFKELVCCLMKRFLLVSPSFTLSTFILIDSG